MPCIFIRNNFLFVLLFTILFQQTKAQKASKGFRKLSCAEKGWVIFHPFIAKKAYRISQQVNHTVDSLYKIGIPDKIKNGGKLDAFRHAYWMLVLSKAIGKRRAYSLGKAHERNNKKYFKRKIRKDDEPLSDYASTQMDLKNDSLALTLIDSNNLAKDLLINFLLKKIKSGFFFMIKHNKEGRWLDKKDNIISTTEWKKSWINERCLVKTDK